jgi:tripartite-type tricarboxylate transporter receptor subunit TctC
MGHIGTLAVNPGLYPTLGYDPRTSFQPIALIAVVASILVVPPSMPVHDVAGLLQLARQKPNGLNFGTAGNGSAAHIAMAAFMEASNTQMVHVPYRGTGPMVNDLLAGQLSLSMTGALVVLPHVRAGTLRALGVSSLQRIAAAPELPTIAEAALPGFAATQWYGFVAPAGIPADVTATLNQAINQILAQPEVIERLKDEGSYPQPETPAAFGQLIASEIERWGAVIKRTGMKAD